MNKIKDRIHWVDIAKCFCVVFVIVHHLETNNHFLTKFYEAFFLNGFLFLSGYTYHHRPDFKAFLKRKFRQLMIPWFVFGMLIVITGNIYSPDPQSHHGILVDTLYFLIQIRGLNDAMWFLAALFVCFIPFYFLIYYYNKIQSSSKQTGLYLGILFLYVLSMAYEYQAPPVFPWGHMFPWHIEYIPVALYFMFLGYLYQRYESKLLQDRYRKPFTLILFIVYIIVIYSGIADFRKQGMYQNITYYLMTQCISILLLVNVSKLINHNRIMCLIGQNSLIYFGIAHYFNIPMQYLLKKAAPEFYAAAVANEWWQTLLCLSLAILSSIILIVPAEIIRRYFPFLLGRSRSVNK